METWLIYGVIAAFLLGACTLMAKMASGKENLGLDSHLILLLTATGIFVVSLAYYFAGGGGVPTNNTVVMLGLGGGAFWALANVFIYKAYNIGANASQMVPVYNLNTLVVVVLAILLLRELPDAGQAMRVTAGAALMIIGAFLVSI
ncbi:MAG: hypothetical protein NT157_03000 [Candidatus Micrarchaeota archaeon]|nr:hypothetical protein [Candidatus Micrarchaeota archaeon]